MTIVVPVIRDPDRLRRCLFLAIDVAHQDEVAVDLVLVLDGASDDVHHFVTSDVAGATVLSWPERRGFAAGLNAGFRVAATQYVAVLQDDVEVQPGWLRSTLKTAHHYPRAAAIGSLVLWPDRTVQTAGAVIGGDGFTVPPWFGDPPGRESFVDVRTVDYVSASTILVRREAWAAVGGFDEDLYPGIYVDADFCTALWNSGWQVLCDPASVIIHTRSGSTPSSLKAIVWPANRTRFMAKWSAFVSDRQLRPSISMTADEIAQEVRRARSWLDSPPPTTIRTNLGPPVESPVDVYVRRERDLLRKHVAQLQAELDAQGSPTR